MSSFTYTWKKDHITVVALKEKQTNKKPQVLIKYLFLFIKKFEHVFHVNEGILDHSG